MQDRYSKLFRILQLTIDLVVLNAAFFLAGALRFDDLKVENEEYYNYYVQLIVFMNFAWVVVAVMLNSYTFYPGLEIRKSLAKVFNTIIIHGSALALLLVSLKGYYYSRLFFTYFYVTFVPAVLLARIIVMNRLRSYLSKDSNSRPIVLLGFNKSALAFYEELQNRPEFGLRIKAWFGEGSHDAITGPISMAKKWVETNRIEEIYCALPPEDSQLTNWIKIAEQNVVRFRYLPNMGLKNLVNADLKLLGDVPVLAARKEPLEYRHNRLIKRIFDLIFSAFVIVLVYPWLLPILSLAIKASSKGPIFFVQKRSGLNNEIFNVIKFRTMKINEEAHNKQATPDDDRITGVGRFMRKHNLDELPQFINVILGHMSVVGPRPHMTNHTEEYRKLIDEFMVRHLINPGITGLAQSRGLRGETQDPESMRNRVKADVYYLENWSLLLDLKIIGDTIWNMLLGRAKGA